MNAVKAAKANENCKWKVSWNETWKSKDLLYWFRECLHEKINRELDMTGRKHCSQYQSDLRWDARAINAYFKGIRHLGNGLLRTKEMKAKYPQVDKQWVDC